MTDAELAARDERLAALRAGWRAQWQRDDAQMRGLWTKPEAVK